jgi:hypothetical protein
MASQNVSLAATTSRLIAASAGAEAGGDAAAVDGWLCSGSAAGIGGLAAFSSGAAAGGHVDARGLLGSQQQPHARAPAGGAVISPSQAREIGSLLSRLTHENAQFLKARDAAVASRNEALNRAAAAEGEAELRQTQLR